MALAAVDRPGAPLSRTGAGATRIGVDRTQSTCDPDSSCRCFEAVLGAGDLAGGNAR